MFRDLKWGFLYNLSNMYIALSRHCNRVAKRYCEKSDKWTEKAINVIDELKEMTGAS